MPIALNDLNAITQSNVKIFSPTFFDKVLTGKGKTVGLLNENRNPIYVPANTTTSYEHIQTIRRKITSGNTDTNFIPVNPLPANAWDEMTLIHKPDKNKLVKIAENKTNKVTIEMAMPVHSLTLEETMSKTGGKSKKLTTCYQVILFFTKYPTNELYEQVTDYHQNPRYMQSNKYYFKFTCNPMIDIDAMMKDLAYNDFDIDEPAIIDFFNNYSLYEHVAARAEEWNTTIDKSLKEYFENIVKSNNGMATNSVAGVLRRLEMYNVPLELYKTIYSLIQTNFTHDDDTMILCKQNLNLLLSDTLNNLNNNKAQLTSIPVPNTPVNPASLSKFSQEQKRAITATDPLVLVQAGAGTGKSTVILGRIDYMIASGVKPEDITVLSFTNAAADHIKEKNPNIHSMTIASMIHMIYALNFPDHELSNLDTVINSLMIYYPQNSFADRFRKKLIGIKKNDRDSFTSMNNFIEYNYDEVIEMLNTIKQTSLELEIIICYQQIDKFIEPAEVASKYLIIDEVQDNSIFEFIYTLKYVDKHKESLFIVGDCSQTLYEFRASNPKALNILEGSGVFTAYQLQVNYRSNQAILDFANIALENIEANQYANIQLRANSLNPVTLAEFTNAVHFSYYQVKRLKDFNDALGPIFAKDIKPYIESKLNAGEKVAFLAYTRNHVNLMKDTLEKMFPNKNIVSIVPDKMHNSTLFSEFIKRYWNEVQFIPTQSLSTTISRCIIQRLDYLTADPTKSLPFAQKLITQWLTEEDSHIKMWTNEYTNNQISIDTFMDNVKDCMLQFEIKHNAIKQALLSARNDENKNNQNVENADMILSTIHSAKGLEFDNVVVIYQNNDNTNEEKKRMYYVAFTRAMKSEYIIAYDTVKSPQIEADYKTIIDFYTPNHVKKNKTIKI